MVEPLKVSAHGFNAYNSSDFIIRPKGMKNAYFGVSLKKKFSAAAADPTIINKALMRRRKLISGVIFIKKIAANIF